MSLGIIDSFPPFLLFSVVYIFHIDHLILSVGKKVIKIDHCQYPTPFTLFGISPVSLTWHSSLEGQSDECLATHVASYLLLLSAIPASSNKFIYLESVIHWASYKCNRKFKEVCHICDLNLQFDWGQKSYTWNKN